MNWIKSDWFLTVFHWTGYNKFFGLVRKRISKWLRITPIQSDWIPLRNFRPSRKKKIYWPNIYHTEKHMLQYEWIRTKFLIQMKRSERFELIQLWNLVLIHSDSFGLIPRIESEWMVLSWIDFRPIPRQNLRKGILYERIRAIPKFVSEPFGIIPNQSEKCSEPRMMQIG